MLLTRDEARSLIDKVLSYSKADDCEVSIGASDVANNRFANNSITTTGETRAIAITISSTRGTQTGSSATNETGASALKAAVEKSEELAGYAPPDPEYVEPIGTQRYAEVPGAFDQATADAGQREMNAGIGPAIEECARKGLTAAGYIEREADALAIGNKRGNFGYALRTNVDYSVTVRTPDGTGSGWASAEGTRMAEVDVAAAGRYAIDKAVMSQKPRSLEPGKYTVVLEHAAVAGMVPQLFGAFNARNAEEGRSYLSRRGGGTRLGEKLFSERVSARSDPFDPRNPGLPWSGSVSTSLSGVGQFFFGGGAGGGASFLPAEKVLWIEKGVVKNLAHSRYWARKKGVQPTPNPGQGLVIEGEDHSVEDLIKSTERGLLVTHFFYIRFVNPQTIQLTGLTRDGVFMIENGKVAYPVMNLRWNESPANVLANVEMLSRPKRIGNAVLPAMKVREFNFTSLSDAV
jgi:predicted Zn-dependent protease